MWTLIQCYGKENSYCYLKRLIVVDQLHMALFSASEQTHVTVNEWLVALNSVFLTIHPSGVLTALFGCYMMVSCENCCHLGAPSVYTIQPCTSLQCYSKPHTLIWSFSTCLVILCFHNPPDPNMDYRIFNMCKWSFSISLSLFIYIYIYLQGTLVYSPIQKV